MSPRLGVSRACGCCPLLPNKRHPWLHALASQLSLATCLQVSNQDSYLLPHCYFLRQAEQTKEEQKQDLNAEKLMRQASKDVCRLREQSRKVPRQVQSFR